MAADADAITVNGHELQAVTVVRDRPLHWISGGTYETGRWIPGDLVTARVESDQPQSIVVFAHFTGGRRTPSTDWSDVWSGSTTEYEAWDGNWALPAGYFAPNTPLTRWLASVTVPGDPPDWPTGAPSTADFTAWAVRERDGHLVALRPREDGRLVDEGGREPKLATPVEPAVLNAALARTAPPGFAPLRWDPNQSVLRCPPDRRPTPAEGDLAVQLGCRHRPAASGDVPCGPSRAGQPPPRTSTSRHHTRSR